MASKTVLIETGKHNAYGTSRQEILRAASRLFSQMGYAKTTLKDVAKESGANTALVGYHFGNKEGLRQAVVDKTLDEVHKTLDAHLKQNISWESFRDLTKELILFVNTQEDFFRIYGWSMLEGGEQGQKFQQLLLEPLMGKFCVIVQSVRPELTQESAHFKSLLILSFILQYAHFRWHSYTKVKMMWSDDVVLQKYAEHIAKCIESTIKDCTQC